MSDARASIAGVKDAELQATIAESMKRGHARVLDSSYLPADPQYLTPFVLEAQAGDARAKQHVLDGMSQLVYRLAVTYMRKWLTHLPSHASFDDVFGSGLAGLQRGIRDYDPATGNAFTTYATWWIRNGVQSAIYDLAGGGSIRAKALVRGVSPIEPLVGSAMLSLDYQSGEDDEIPMYDFVAAPVEEFDVELVQHVLDLLAAIDPHLPLIVDLIDRNHAFREIARTVGISEPRVRDLLAQARTELADYA